MRPRFVPLLPVAALPLTGAAEPDRQAIARAAAVHPVSDAREMHRWLSRVPVTADFPPDINATLRRAAPAFVIELSSTSGCLPCGDLWSRLQSIARIHGMKVRVIGEHEAGIRAGRLGLPWVGHPVAWLRLAGDERRAIPIAIGTDHAPNLTRNIYLAIKMQTGVRAAIGVRALSKFTGIVGATPRTATNHGRD
ncbi:hypothetical protein [Sphingobium yanoikuyae]|uniref:hypothetical protein n=1 Tax=Sphingobium yanoikuyae TaxID=13690 RepID=UPI0035B178BE